MTTDGARAPNAPSCRVHLCGQLAARTC